MAVLNVSDDSFETDVLKNEKPVLVDFWAEWCGPCKMMAPVIDSLAEEHENIQFAKLDTDANPNSAQSYQITGIPCCIVFKGGEEVGRIIGFRAKDALETELKEILGL